VRVRVAVGCWVIVRVGVVVGVDVGVIGVFVAVGTRLPGVSVTVAVGVSVGVAVGVSVGAAVGVVVGVGVFPRKADFTSEKVELLPRSSISSR